MLRSLVYVNRHLTSGTSQGNQELCTSSGSARSQSANWEVAEAEQMYCKNTRDVCIYKAKSSPPIFVLSSLVLAAWL